MHLPRTTHIRFVGGRKRKAVVTLLLVTYSSVPAQTVDVQALIRDLNNESQLLEKRLAAADSLKSLGSLGKDAIGSLITILENKRNSDSLRWKAAGALGQMPEAKPAALQTLVQVLDDDSNPSGVRRMVVEALGELRPQEDEVINVIIKALKLRSNDGVPSAAAEALGKIATPRCIIALVEAVSDRASYESPPLMSVGPNAAAALGQAGGGGRDGIGPLSEMIDDPNPFNRKAAVEALVSVTISLANDGATESIGEVTKAAQALERNKYPEISAYAKFVVLALKVLESKQGITKEAFRWAMRNPLTATPFAAIIIYLLVASLLLGLCTITLWMRPFLLLRVNEHLRSISLFKLSILGSELQIPIRYLLIVGLFHGRRRVLDSWVSAHILSIRRNFDLGPARDHGVHVPVHVLIEARLFDCPGTGKSERDDVARADPEEPEVAKKMLIRDLREVFRENGPACLVIYGTGLSGKTSLACQIARYAMAMSEEDWIGNEIMVPIVIKPTDAVKASTTGDFTAVVRDQLRSFVPNSSFMSPVLLNHLAERRILAIFDGFDDFHQDSHESWPFKFKVITSRSRDFGSSLPRVPARLPNITDYSSFLTNYLSQRKVSLYTQEALSTTTQQLAMLCEEGGAPVGLLKLLLDRVSSNVRERLDTLNVVPAVMIQYLMELNRDMQGEDTSTPNVVMTAKVIAWECVKQHFRPGEVSRVILRARLASDTRSRVVAHLEKYLQIIAPVDVEGTTLRFTYPQLAEYLAALHIVDINGEDQERWKAFEKEGWSKLEAGFASHRFLRATYECYRSHADWVPNSILHNLALPQRTGVLSP
jgi:hypothetical protein